MAKIVALLTKDEAVAVAGMALDWLSSTEAGETFGTDIYYMLVKVRENLMDQPFPMVVQDDFGLVADMVEFFGHVPEYEKVMPGLEEMFEN